MVYIENEGTKNRADFAGRRTHIVLPTNEIDELDNQVYGYLWFTRTVAADIDADGDQDILFFAEFYTEQDYEPSVCYVENVGDKKSPKWSMTKQNPFEIRIDPSPQMPIYYVNLAAADVDRDGDIDLFFGGMNYDEQPSIVLLENEPVDGLPRFSAPVLNPWGLMIDGDIEDNIYAKLCFADLDGDGDLDLLFGIGESGRIYYSENDPIK